MSPPQSLAAMSLSIRWISCFRFLESLRHCTGVFLLWFSRKGSIMDPDTSSEVSFSGNVCNSTSFLC